MFPIGRSGGYCHIDVRITCGVVCDVYRVLYENASNEVLSEAYDRRLITL